MTMKFAEWVAKHGTAQQKATFAAEYNVTGGNLNFTPDTQVKLALWEAYCAAVNKDPALPGPGPV